MGTDRSKLEHVKEASDFLRGGLADELDNDQAGFSGEAAQVLKFHGIYQQDDRDVRRERAKQGLGKDMICMVRAAVPGGVLSAEQYLVMDHLAGRLGNDTLRVTTRQGIQFHFTRKGGLRELVRTLNEHLVTTLAACGDNVRNVMCCPAPPVSSDRALLQDYAAELSRHLKPATNAYWQLWVDGERAASLVAADASEDTEPLYGPTYLPRKFKIGLAPRGDNCIDVYTQDVGIVPQLSDGGDLEGFTLLVGGGLGMTHNKPETYPRLADPLCSVRPADLVDTVKGIVAIQRDHGDRSDRKHARMKYLVAERGVDWFRAELSQRVDVDLGEPVVPTWESTDDHLGWHVQGRETGGRAAPGGGGPVVGRETGGRAAPGGGGPIHDEDVLWLGVHLPNGRIGDDGIRYRSGLRRVVERFGVGLRFTPRQDLLLTDIRAADREAVEAELRAHGIPLVSGLTPVARHALACPALPTCGLALAEAERVSGGLVDGIDAVLADVGLPRETVHVRLTGCPNGCARPYSTEIGIVGRGKDRYVVFLGGDQAGTRLNTAYADQVAMADVPAVLAPVLAAYRDERHEGETFGDFCDRVGVARLRERFDPDGELARGRPALAGQGRGR